MKNKGFTFIEMIAVITLIALLSVIGIATYRGMNESAKRKTLEAKIHEIKIAAEKWARENHINNQIVISVNALVVEGYINADKVETNGIAEIKNPVTGENMICDTVEINFNGGEMNTIYNDKIQNCKLATQSLVDTNITVKIIDSEGIDISGSNVSSMSAWTNNDVVIIVNSEKYETSSLVSVSYDFEGNTITKNVSDLEKYEGSSFISDAECKKYYNVFPIKADLLLNSKIVVTYNFMDDLSKSRAYTIRIDKEEATALVETSSEWVSEITPVTVKVDDGKGSGPKYFYTTTSPAFTNPEQYPITYKGVTSNMKIGKYYIWTEDSAGNRSEKYKLVIDVSNVDDTIPDCEVLFHGKEGDHGWYISDVTPAGKNTIVAGISGMNVGVSMDENSPSYTGYAPNGTLNEGYGVKRTAETVKQGEDYWCHVKTLAGKTAQQKRRLFLDKTAPVIRIGVDNPDEHTQTKTAHVQISDALSGLNESTTISYGFSMSSTVPPSNWTPVTISASVQTNDVVKKDFTTSEKLTGTYYMWIDTSGFKDYAGNYPDSNDGGPVSGHMFIYGPYKFDNTPPVCNGNNGKKSWTKGEYTIEQKCIDNYGTIDQSLCAKDVYTIKYTNRQTVKEDKVTISDKAGNMTVCDYDVYLDNTAPICGTNNSKQKWSKGTYTINQKCEEDRNTQSGCGKDEYSFEYKNTTKSSSIDIFDAVGNKTNCPNDVYLDNTPPICNGVTGTSKKWSNQERTIVIKCKEDEVNQSGCSQKTFTYKYNTNTTTALEKIFDNVGNESTCGPFDIYVDFIAPTCGTNNGKQKWSKGTYTINQNCLDDGADQSQCKKKVYSTEYKNTTKTSSVVIYDVANNSATCYYDVYLDNTPPICGTNNSKQKWSKGTYTINQKCEEDRNTQSGCGKDEYSFEYKNTTKSSSIDIFDAVGNKTNCPNDVYLDNTPPSCNGVTGTSKKWSNQERTIVIKCKEDEVNQSGCSQKTFTYKYNTNTTTASEKILDKVGNESTCGPFDVYVDFIAPTCGTNNGKTDWSKGTYTINQNCLDDGANQSQCKKKVYSTEYKNTTKTSSVVIYDVANNSETCYYDVYLDNTSPSCDGVGGKKSWSKGTYTVVQKCKEDRSTQSGCGKDEYTEFYESTTKTSSIDIFDTVGNKTNCPVDVYLDNTPPSCGDVSGNSTYWTGSNRTVSVKCIEDKSTQSGCEKDTFSKTANYSVTTDSIDINDGVGNKTTCGPYDFYVDKVAPSCVVDNYGNQCTKAGVTARVTCTDPTPDSSEMKQCAGSAASPTDVSGIKGTATYVVKDGANNVGRCYGYSTAVGQSKKRTCKSGSRCACDYEWKKDGYCKCGTESMEGDGSWTVSFSKLSSCPSDCRNRCGGKTNAMIKGALGDCYDQKYNIYCNDIPTCGCGSWNSWSGWDSTSKDCSGYEKNSCEVETRTVYHSAGETCP